MAGFAALIGLAVGGSLDDTSEPSGDDPVESLVDAFARSRMATYRIAGTFVREAAEGARLEVPVEMVQRPPDRLRRQFGEISGRRDDRALLCPPASGDDDLQCTLGEPRRTFDETVAAEVGDFRALVTADEPLYEVRRPIGADGPGPCWHLTRTRPDPRGGYGESAELCFDPASGALVEIHIDHGDIDEHQVFTEITTDVTDEMLEP